MPRIELFTLFSWQSRAVALVTLLAVACGGDSKGTETSVLRFVQSDPTEIFQRESLLDTEIVRSWKFRGPEDLADWTLNLETDDYIADRAGLLLHPERRYATMELSAKIDAASLNALEIRLRGLPRHRVILQWRREDQSYSQRREVAVPLGRDDSDGFRLFRLAVGSHPKWKGTIVGLRFGFMVPKGRQVLVDRVDAIVEKVSPTRLAEALTRSWKVELDNDLRNGFLAQPEIPNEHAIQVRENMRLWFSYGLQERVPAPTTFRITVSDEDNRETVLFEDRLEKPGVWKDAVVDLSRFAQRSIDLRFLTSADEFDPILGFPLWANPEAVRLSSRPMNILLISIDTLRADHLSLYGYQRPTTPSIDRWASERGVVFENTIAAAPWTLPSHMSMLTGLNAHRHGVNYSDRTSAIFATLAEVLRSAGYATLAVTGGGFVHPQYGFSRGFDRYRTQGAAMADDEELERGLASAIATLERYKDRPFFLFFHTYEVHNPFRARDPYMEQLTGRTTDLDIDTELKERRAQTGFMEDRSLRPVISRDGAVPDPLVDAFSLAVDLYDSQIAYSDEAIGRLLHTLDRLDLASRTIVVLTSDHGELFGEHGLSNHVSLYEDNLRVPLIIAAPGRSWQGRRIEEQVRSIDIMPTLLELLNIGDLGDLDGISLVALIETGKQLARDDAAISYAAASNHGISLRQGNRYKYLFRNSAWVSEDPEELFFDLVSDPGEVESYPSLDTTGERLRSVLLRRFSVESAGLRVLLSNLTGTAPLRGFLRGPDLQLGRPKALEVGSAVLRRGAGNTAHFEIEPGQRALIFLEGARNPLEIQVFRENEDLEPLSVRVDTDVLDAVQAILTTEGGATVETMSEPDGDGVFVWWQGRRLEQIDTSGAIDAELQQQLEALGYIDN